MKHDPKTLVLALVWAAVVSQGSVHVGWAQGTLIFVNFYGDPSGFQINAPVTYLDGSRVGREMTAQIYAAPAGAPLTNLQPVHPARQFESGEYSGYVFGGTLHVPDIWPGAMATVVMRAFDGDSWETSLCRGESGPITITLTGGLGTDAPLEGLEPFSVNCIPEPGVVVLAGLGAAELWVARRRGRSLFSGA